MVGKKKKKKKFSALREKEHLFKTSSSLKIKMFSGIRVAKGENLRPEKERREEGKDTRKQSRKKAVKMIENVLTADVLYTTSVCRKVLSSTQDFGMWVSLR